MTRTLWVVMLLICGFLTSSCNESNADVSVEANQMIHFDWLQTWKRRGDPVLRDRELHTGYEIAADPHVFRTNDGALRMVYTGPHPSGNDYGTIKMAKASSHFDWSVGTVLLSGSKSGNQDINKETSFYRLAKSGKHQIYYIGYENESVYASQVFLAESDHLEGPYSLPTKPIIPLMTHNGFEVKTITSPSIVEHDNKLFMVYCAWNDFPTPSEVQVHGATSDDDGQTWLAVGKVNVPSCMEGSITKGPDGLFYAVAQVEDEFSIGRSKIPFPVDGYEMLPLPVMTPAGEPWEIEEMNTPQLFFEDNMAYLYYSGADYSKGWWVMLATASLAY